MLLSIITPPHNSGVTRLILAVTYFHVLHTHPGDLSGIHPLKGSVHNMRNILMIACTHDPEIPFAEVSIVIWYFEPIGLDLLLVSRLQEGNEQRTLVVCEDSGGCEHLHKFSQATIQGGCVRANIRLNTVLTFSKGASKRTLPMSAARHKIFIEVNRFSKSRPPISGSHGPDGVGA